MTQEAGHNSSNNFSRFINIDRGSVFEARCQLLIAKNINYIEKDRGKLFKKKISEVSKIITALIKN